MPATIEQESAVTPPKGPAISLSHLGNRHGKSGMGLPTEAVRKLEALAGVPEADRTQDEAVAISTPANEPKPKTPTPEPPKPVTPPGNPPVADIHPKPETKQDFEKGGIKAVREALERRETRVKELEASETATKKEIADAKAAHLAALEKLTSYESEIEKTYKPQVQRLSEVEKRLQEREEQLRIRDFTTAPEWHDKYVKPIVEARTEAEQLMDELIVTDENGERKATKQDFDAVLSSPNMTQAVRTAKELFGDDLASTVVGFRTKILSAERTRQGAFKNAALESAERQKQDQAKFAEHRQALRQKLLAESERLASEAPHIFKPGEDEKDLAEALAEGTKLADLSMNGDPNITEDAFLKVVAKVRSRAAGYPVMEKRMSKLQAENESLKTQLKEYQRSEPNVEGGRTPVVNGDEDATADEAHAKLTAAAAKYASRY